MLTLKCNTGGNEKLCVDEMPVGWDDLGTQRQYDLVEIEILSFNRYVDSVILSESDTEKLIVKLQEILSKRKQEKE